MARELNKKTKIPCFVESLPNQNTKQGKPKKYRRVYYSMPERGSAT
jgi:hypothetical protein